MQPIKSDTEIAVELQSAFSSQEDGEHFPGTTTHGEAPHEDEELFSLQTLMVEAFIQALLNGAKEEIEDLESLDCMLC